MKVVVTSLFGDGFEESLREEFGELEFVFAVSEDEQAREMKDADVFMGSPSREVFLAADHLRWLHCPGTGIDKLTEIPEIVDSDVVLTNARGPHTAPMADHVMAFCLAFAHKTHNMLFDQQARVWDASKYHGEQVEMEGATMGILALGGIGQAVARRANGFGMNVYAVDMKPFPSSARGQRGVGTGEAGRSAADVGLVRGYRSLYTGLQRDDRSARAGAVEARGAPYHHLARRNRGRGRAFGDARKRSHRGGRE